MGALNIHSSLGSPDCLAPVLKELTGVVVPPHKNYLFQQRLSPFMSQHGIATFEELASRLGTDLTIRREFIHLMTTHETSFFRDIHPFETLRTSLLPELLQRLSARQRAGRPPNAFTVWSAAASSGKEVYTLAMLVDQLVTSNPQWGLDANRIRILGTDISEPVLEEARSGVYGEGEGLRGLPREFRDGFLEKKDRTYEVAPHLKRRCTFRRVDLTKRFTLGPFDLVLVRNVLIYFDNETRERVLHRIHDTLASDGVLLLGSSEAVDPGASHLYSPQHKGRTRYYIKATTGSRP
jgi:chemotaxis protein methyltransferase CheR